MATQCCRVCGTEKPLSEFSYRKDTGKHRTDCKACRSVTDITRIYGISADDYHALLEKQDNRCAICGTHSHDVQHQTFTRLVVDHDHQTGDVRGLLCPACNLVLGQAKDTIEILENAIAYLRQKQ